MMSCEDVLRTKHSCVLPRVDMTRQIIVLFPLTTHDTDVHVIDVTQAQKKPLCSVVFPRIGSSKITVTNRHRMVVEPFWPIWFFTSVHDAETNGCPGYVPLYYTTRITDIPNHREDDAGTYYPRPWTLYHVHTLCTPEYRELLKWLIDETSTRTIVTCKGVLERVDGDTLRFVDRDETFSAQDYIRKMEVRSSDTFNVLTVREWHKEFEVTRCGTDVMFVHVLDSVITDTSVATETTSPRAGQQNKRRERFEDTVSIKRASRTRRLDAPAGKGLGLG